MTILVGANTPPFIIVRSNYETGAPCKIVQRTANIRYGDKLCQVLNDQEQMRGGSDWYHCEPKDFKLQGAA